MECQQPTCHVTQLSTPQQVDLLGAVALQMFHVDSRVSGCHPLQEAFMLECYCQPLPGLLAPDIELIVGGNPRNVPRRQCSSLKVNAVDKWHLADMVSQAAARVHQGGGIGPVIQRHPGKFHAAYRPWPTRTALDQELASDIAALEPAPEFVDVGTD